MKKSMPNSSSSSSSKASLSPHHPPHFTPIEEGNEEEDFSQGRISFRTTPASEYTHFPTPLYSDKSRRSVSASSAASENKRQESDDSGGISCNKCRPSNRDRFSVVPLENGGGSGGHNHHLSTASPNGIFKSILASLALKKSPKLSESASSTASREDHWKIVVAELSNKLIQTSRRRDDAVLEASKLKHSMTELEKKLNKLEIYCHSLKSDLDGGRGAAPCHYNPKPTSSPPPPASMDYHLIKVGDQEKVIEHFLVAVSETRSSARFLSRALSLQLRQMGPKVYDRIAMLLQPYDIKISMSRNPRALVFYLEALLNRAFFEDFECPGFQKSGPSPILNPIDRCESNFAMFSRLHGLTWEEVLNKGTRHFSEDFSKFCDRKMSDVVAMLGWNRAWPEPLLQAFFGASKAVWLVHLLANSLHPGLPVFRIDKGVGFDAVYMEDMGGDKAKKLVPTMVRIMVTPGFYVYENVVKCKVLCRYYNNNGFNEGFTPSPS